jgi:hypothetical protein
MVKSGISLAIIVLFGCLHSGVVISQADCDNLPFDITQVRDVWDKTDFCIYQDGVFDQIISGGVPRDGIPPIDVPQFESIADAAAWLQPQSPVIVLELENEVRAYPLAILTRHEIVNDIVGETAVAVTFCPLCNSAIVFDRTVDGQTLRFGVSGLLRNSDLIMWDDATQSWWQQFTGQGMVGQFTGTQLTMLPSQVVGFGQYAAQYPEGMVLSRTSGLGDSYGSNPYVGYDSSEQPFLFTGSVDARLPATERVLAGFVDETAVAYPFSVLSAQVVINDTVSGENVVALWQGGVASALDGSDINASKDVGTAALFRRELGDQTLTFTVGDDAVIRDDQTGSTWNVFGSAITGDLQGAQLEQIIAAPHFWFAWAAFQPDTLLYGE